MSRQSAAAQAYADLLDRFGSQVAEAFLAAVDDLRNAVSIQRLIVAIGASDFQSAVEALNIDQAAFSPLLEAIRAGYLQAGTAVAGGLPAVALVRFDIRNLVAEAWLQEHSSTLVTAIVEDQRTAVRNHLEARMQEGTNPRTTALDIVGRINRATNRREGGVLGLTDAQTGWVRSYQAAIGGDVPTTDALERQLRDKRFDRTVAKAIREGKPIPVATQERMVAAYNSKALRYRGEMIGRTESLTALRAAKHESYRQAVESGTVQEQDIRRTWYSASDSRVRHTHQVLNGQTVGMNQPFISPSGARLMYPGDTSLGAGAEEIVACRCDVRYRVDWLANIR